MPETTDATETVTLSEDTEQKVRSANAKVTLVKPMQPETTDAVSENTSLEAETVPAKKQSPRPKVGRSGAARKKKSEKGGQESEQEKKKTGKSKSKSENVAAQTTEDNSHLKADKSSALKKKSEELGAVETGTVEAKIADKSDPSTTEHESPSQKLRVEQLQEELAKMELPSDWEMEHSRPWSFPLILLIVALFVATSWALATIANNYHKTKNTASVSTASTEPTTTPAQFGESRLQEKVTKPVTNVTTASAMMLSSAAAQNSSAQGTMPGAVVPPSPAITQSVASTPVVVSSTQGQTRADAPTPPAQASSAGTGATAASIEQKANNQQELFSILNKE